MVPGAWALFILNCVLLSGCQVIADGLTESSRQQAREDYNRGDIDRDTYEERMRQADEADDRNSNEDQGEIVVPQEDE